MSVVPSRSGMMAELKTHLQATLKGVKSITTTHGELTVMVERDSHREGAGVPA